MSVTAHSIEALTYFKVVLHLNPAGAQVLFRVIELVDAVEVGVRRQVHLLRWPVVLVVIVGILICCLVHTCRESVRLHENVVGLTMLRGEIASTSSERVVGTHFLVLGGVCGLARLPRRLITHGDDRGVSVPLLSRLFFLHFLLVHLDVHF